MAGVGAELRGRGAKLSLASRWESGPLRRTVDRRRTSGTRVRKLSKSRSGKFSSGVAGGVRAQVVGVGDVVRPEPSWNGTIAANGGTVGLGFNGTDTGQDPVPAAFYINGAVCSNN